MCSLMNQTQGNSDHVSVIHSHGWDNARPHFWPVFTAATIQDYDALHIGAHSVQAPRVYS
jgi:hypothetical protein